MEIKDITGNKFFLHNGHAKERLKERLNGNVPVVMKKPLSHEDYKKAEKGLPCRFSLQSCDGTVTAPVIKVGNKFFVKTFIKL